MHHDSTWHEESMLTTEGEGGGGGGGFFFFNDTATTEIYTLSLHDALPILLSPFTLQGYGGRI